jgi:hypothetical protein
VEDADLTDGDLLTNEVEINLSVLCALVLDRVGGEVDDADIVAVDKCAPTQKTVKLLKYLAQPTSLNHAISNNVVLCLKT